MNSIVKLEPAAQEQARDWYDLSIVSQQDRGNVSLTTAISFDALKSIITNNDWAPGRFRGARRLQSEFVSTNLLVLDIDDGASLEDGIKYWKDFKHIIGTTKSHQIEKNGKTGDRYRVVLFLEELCTTPAEYKATYKGIAKEWGGLDESCADAARLFYPCKKIVSENTAGRRVQVQKTPAAVAPLIGQQPIAMPRAGSQYGLGALRDASDKISTTPAGARNNTLFSQSAGLFGLVAGGELDEKSVRDALSDAAIKSGLDYSEIENTLASAWRAGSSNPRTAPGDVRAECTDSRNAERLVSLFGERLRFCVDWEQWLAWNGRRWEPNDGKASQFAKDAARQFAADANSLADSQHAKILSQFAYKSENHRAIQATLACAQTDASIAVKVSQLDQCARLLPVTNGTVDLETGKLRTSSPSSFMTKNLSLSFDAAAKCPQWESFLLRIMNGNVEMISFLQRAVGYSLTGEVSEQCLFFLHGSGANGKSVFIRTIAELLGEFAVPAEPDLLLRKFNEPHATGKADLCGRRVAICQEIDIGRSFSEATVKHLTGSDLIQARRMREDFWQFKPSHKFWLASNHKPNVAGTDEGIWRRIKLIPFAITIPEQERDLQLLDKLKGELPGILAWAVQGAVQWCRHGLGAPPAVAQATQKYRDEMDVVSQFINEKCVLGDECRVSKASLRENFERWCEQEGRKPPSNTEFNARLRAAGFEEKNVRENFRRDPVKGWAGLRLL